MADSNPRIWLKCCKKIIGDFLPFFFNGPNLISNFPLEKEREKLNLDSQINKKAAENLQYFVYGSQIQNKDRSSEGFIYDRLKHKDLRERKVTSLLLSKGKRKNYRMKTKVQPLKTKNQKSPVDDVKPW